MNTMESIVFCIYLVDEIFSNGSSNESFLYIICFLKFDQEQSHFWFDFSWIIISEI